MNHHGLVLTASFWGNRQHLTSAVDGREDPILGKPGVPTRDHGSSYRVFRLVDQQPTCIIFDSTSEPRVSARFMSRNTYTVSVVPVRKLELHDAFVFKSLLPVIMLI